MFMRPAKDLEVGASHVGNNGRLISGLLERSRAWSHREGGRKKNRWDIPATDVPGYLRVVKVKSRCDAGNNPQ